MHRFFYCQNTPQSLPLFDIDGNEYSSVIIGSQEWIVENFKCTKYSDDSPITNITGNTAWSTDTSGAYCAYSNNNSNIPVYGLLYNWYAINNDIAYLERNSIQETGWRVATFTDWNTLDTYLGGVNVGGKLKQTELVNWLNPNAGATNETGFNAVGSGFRTYNTGLFQNLKASGDFWTGTQTGASAAYTRILNYVHDDLISNDYPKAGGFPVRMVKDI